MTPPFLRQRWLVLFSSLLGALALWRWFASGAAPGGDWAQYLGHAWALVQGRAYADTGYLYTNLAWTVGPPRYPPGLPVTLAPVLAIFGPSTAAPRFLMHLCLLAFLVLAGRYFSRDSPPALVGAAVALCGASFLLADTPNVVGSDLGFCALVWAVVVLADRDGTWTVGRTSAIALLGSAAILYRIAAAPLIPAVLLLGVLRKRDVGARALLPAAAWIATLAWVVTFFGNGGAPAHTMSGGASGDTGQRWVASLEWLAQRLDSKILRYRFALLDAYLYPFPANRLNDLYHLLALGSSGLGGVIWLRSHLRSFGAGFALFTLAMLAVLPVWSARYLWVLVPFVVYTFVVGVHWLVGRLRSGRPGTAGVVAGICLALIGGAVVQQLLHPAPVLEREEATWAVVRERLRSLQENQGAPLRVASNRPRKVAWYTGVPAMVVFGRELTTFLGEAQRQGVTYGVMTTAGVEANMLARWQEWQRERPDLIAPIDSVGPVHIYRIGTTLSP